MTSGVLADSAAQASETATGAPTGATVSDTVRQRLSPKVRRDPWSWLVTTAVVLIAGALRLIGLSHPPGKIFDEIYYATEGQELFDHGVEWRPESNNGDFVVHPPLGKWIIGVGEWLFGRDSHGDWLANGEFGWRISAAVAGTLSVLIMVRLARRMFGSTVLGATAGLLMALDGLHFILSRTALLDIFLMLFILASFACLVMDRDQRRGRWLAAMENGLDPSATGPAGRLPAPPWPALFVRLGLPVRPRWMRLNVPWWRLAAAILIGCASSVKWSAVWYLVLFVFLVCMWEVGVRRSAGVRHPFRDALLDETGWLIAFVGLAVATYLASWTGWFATDTGWGRHWLAQNGHSEWPVVGALVNLWQYHHAMYTFHLGLSQHHAYQSWPWQWLLLGRPVAFYWSTTEPCGSTSCASEVLLLGTPLLWWSFILALPALAWLGIQRRDWRAAAIGLGAATGIVPWFQYELDDRTMFYFYALPAEPFLILAVVYVLGVIIGPPATSGEALPDRRLVGTIVAGAYIALVAVCFAYFYPIYTGKSITYAQWWAHMWLGGRWV